jgi:uncharacterized membrane protein
MDDHVYIAYDYPILGAFWTMLLIFLWVMWFFLLFRVVVDLFRDDDLSGWAKAGWLVFVLVLPFIGVFVYVLARGGDMGRRERREARARQEEMSAYIREAVGEGGTSEVEELAKLSEIKARGDISDEEFRRAKEKILH